MELTELTRYPVKSCRGQALGQADVRPWGLDGDRRWMIVDPQGRFVTGREVPRLVQVEPALVRGPDGAPALRLHAPGQPDLEIAEPSSGPELTEPVTIWRDTVAAAPGGEAAAEWLQRALGRPARLVFLDDPYRRAVDPRYGRDDDVVSFADGFPLLLTTQESLGALNDWVLEGAHRDEAPLSMTRFRPNVVVRGAPAWAEDDWKRLRIGAVEFRAVKGCGRCVFTTVDPITAEKGREPLATLARYRNWDGNLWFGVNLIPDLPEDGPVPSVRVGDPVEILD